MHGVLKHPQESMAAFIFIGRRANETPVYSACVFISTFFQQPNAAPLPFFIIFSIEPFPSRAHSAPRLHRRKVYYATVRHIWASATPQILKIGHFAEIISSLPSTQSIYINENFEMPQPKINVLRNCANSNEGKYF